MRNVVTGVGRGMILPVAMLVLAGCGGTGEMVYLDVIPKQAPAQMAEPEAVKVVVAPFEDRRIEKNRLGMRTHLWGGVTYFNVAGDKPGEVYAQALAERLRARGWHDRSWDVRVVPGGAVSNADIVINGQIMELSANAKGRTFSTALSANSKVTISARNTSDQSTTNRTIEGSRTDTVFWFSEEDLQALLRETIKDTIDRYLEDTKISERALRPGRP